MGMYTDCQDEIIRALKAAGCAGKPFTSKKLLTASSESHVSAVLCEDDRVERASGKKTYTAQDGRTLKRSRRFDRDITYTVIIGDYQQKKAEETWEKFLLELAAGIYVDGNYVSINPEDAQWMGEKDHILFARVAVQAKIVCHGGLYLDTDMTKLKEIETEVRKGG